MIEKIYCPDCNSEMEEISEYHYTSSTKPNRKIDAIIYHCYNCGHDEVIEEEWELISKQQRRYFHG